VLTVLVFLFGLVVGVDADAPTHEARLRQTGVARGYVAEVVRSGLCELAEESAWDLVWRSCDDENELENVTTGGCATIDYRPPVDDGRGAFMEVRVQVEYDCTLR
jgi:hypothetical protein